MKKKLIISDEKLLEEFISIFAVGITCCLENKLIDTNRAEQWLFSPTVAYSLKNLNVSEELTNAMEFSSEIDACRNAPYFNTSVVEAREKFINIIKKINENTLDKQKQIELFLDLFK